MNRGSRVGTADGYGLDELGLNPDSDLFLVSRKNKLQSPQGMLSSGYWDPFSVNELAGARCW
jgi:hypothetical protein